MSSIPALHPRKQRTFMATVLDTSVAPRIAAEQSPDWINSQNRDVATIRVLHLINGEHYAGAERVQDLLALGLPDFGIQPAMACLKPGRFAETRRSQATPLYQLPMRSRWDFRPVWHLARLLRHERFDILHTHTPRAALIGRVAATLAGVPMVHHVHGQTATEVRGRWWTRLMARIERTSLSRAAAVIAVSSSAAEYMARQGIAKSRLRVIPNGVPARAALPPRAIPATEWTLGMVGLLRPRKGLETVLDALALLRRQGFAVRLRVIGSFETTAYQREVEQHVERLGIGAAVDWAGFCHDIDTQLVRLDLMAFPSLLAEGMPMVVLEAMAAGVPLVASRVAGVTDVLRDGVEGLLCKPGDPADLAGAISRVLRGTVCWESLRSRAHRRQSEEFSDSAMARSVAELYREILDSADGR
jgi:glycosyltransferase involved in cell wall biosynthesis